jgi:thiol-disulfide isomerase/thioredoxin
LKGLTDLHAIRLLSGRPRRICRHLLTFCAGSALLLLSASVCARAADLAVGAMAPPVEPGRFLKGVPVDTLPRGQVGVVMFWSTSCPAIRSQSRALSALAQRYPSVRFLAVDDFEDDPLSVAPFVVRMGDWMNFTVMIDLPPDGGGSGEGAMEKSWYDAANLSDRPAMFIVDASGRIAWIGGDFDALGTALPKIAAGGTSGSGPGGAHSVAGAAGPSWQAAVFAARSSGDAHRLLAAIQAAMRQDPSAEAPLGVLRFDALVQSGDRAGAARYGDHLVDAVYRGDAAALAAFAPIAQADAGGDPAIAAVGRRAAARAAALRRH